MELYIRLRRDEMLLRYGAWVLCLTRRPLRFSERYGYERYLAVPRGWRLWLRRRP